MTDRDALVRAVLAAPDDDTPRLVLADWLDEHGDPHRAELIRVGCELARLDREAPWVAAATDWLAHNSTFDHDARDPRYWADDLPDVARRTRLASRHGWLHLRCVTAERARAPKVRGERRPWAGHFVRGFIESIRVPTAEHLVAHAEALWGFSPVRAVRVGQLTIAGAADIVRAGLLARLDHLANEPPEVLRVYGASPDAAGVRSVALDSRRTVDCLTELATSPHWSGVRELWVFGGHGARGNGARLTAADGELLASARHLRRLERLTMTFCGFDGPAFRRVCGAAWPDLQVLDLGYTGFDDDAAEALAANPTLGRLRVLEVNGNRLTARGADALIRSPNLAGLTVLDVSYNPLERGSARKWSGPCRPPTLRALTLGMSQPSAASCRAWAACPSLTGLVALKVGGVESGAAEFAAATGWDRLKVLDLGYASLDAAGVERLAAAPLLATVQLLSLRDNPLGEAGARALAASPHLGQLRQLKASSQGVGKAGEKALAARLGKKWKPG